MFPVHRTIFFADFEYGNDGWNTLLPWSKFLYAFQNQI